MTNFGGVLQMVVLYTVLSMLGTCLCYVPGILFMPLSFGGIFLAYREIFPLERNAAPPAEAPVAE